MREQPHEKNDSMEKTNFFSKLKKRTNMFTILTRSLTLIHYTYVLLACSGLLTFRFDEWDKTKKFQTEK